ncbi:MAG TPA: GDSL-type esterase/lipase family protein [Enhygromyxa sp.]|nr:GDSL-type esterase/lipase family protein [Enhygromyxa sp.]
MPRPRTTGIRGSAGVLSALLLGCCCTTSPPQAAGPAQADDSVRETEAGATEAGIDVGDHDEVLPAYNPEALAARYDAQRALLGDESLFEDIEGNPVTPTIAPQVGGELGSIDDDILLSLPGSAGFGLDGTAREEAVANGNALGLYVPIENPRSGPALAHFHEALRKLEAGEDEDGKVRVLVYGASHTQADVYPGYLRAYLQARFGNGGQGFVSVVKVNKWFRYADWNIEESKGWICEHAQRSSSRKDGYYGLLGACGSATSKRDKTLLVPRHEAVAASDYELWYLAQPGGGRLELLVDGNKQGIVDTDAKQIGPGYHPFSVDAGAHTIEVRAKGDGEIRLFGLVMETETPGVVVDTLGIAGTRAANMLAWDQAIWTDNLRRRDPDLYILAYGTNEATDEDQPISVYRDNLREVLTRLRNAAPDASCLLLGPGDFPREIEEDVWVPRPRVAQIIEVQRDVAYEMGCGFWDALAFMGGVNSMHTWATARPQMASRDHIHLTKRGYVRMGMAVTDAMMASFDRALSGRSDL